VTTPCRRVYEFRRAVKRDATIPVQIETEALRHDNAPLDGGLAAGNPAIFRDSPASRSA